MSLPDAPNTLREKYYSVMAGQNDADILPDIEAAPSTENRYLDYIAKHGGGGGDVTKEYVDNAIATAVADKVDKVEGKGLSTNDYTNADKALVQGSPITTTSTTSPIADSADGMAQGITIYGRSEVVEGEIKSVGDDGLAVSTANSGNTLTTSVNFTTALPLRGVSDTVRDKLICTAEKKQVETVYGEVDLGTLEWDKDGNNRYYHRFTLNFNMKTWVKYDIPNLICSKYSAITQSSYDRRAEYGLTITLSSNFPTIMIYDEQNVTANDFKTLVSGVMLIYELAEPVTTPLTDAEISAFRGLKTYDGTTNIAISDEPDFELDYLKNTENGQAVADIQRDLQEQIDDSSGGMTETTLYEGWTVFDVNGTITLSDDGDKYDALIIYTSYHETSTDDYYTHYGRCIIPKNDILRSIAETPEGKTYSGFVDAPASTSTRIYSMTWIFNMPDKKTLVSKGKDTGNWSSNQCGVYKIVGVKY